jgi:hypothetical protein
VLFLQSMLMGCWKWAHSLYLGVDAIARKALYDSMHTLVTVSMSAAAIDALLQMVEITEDYILYTALLKLLSQPRGDLLQVGLILAVLLGAVGVGGFVGLQVAQEARMAVVAVTEALPAWTLKPPDQNSSLAVQVPCRPSVHDQHAHTRALSCLSPACSP